MSIEAYKNNSVETASPGELTLMLYNGGIKFIQTAMKSIESKQFEKKNTSIQRAQAVISELTVTMNRDYSISKEVLPLYEYMNRRLIEANVKNDIEALKEVEELFVDFRDTWKQVILIDRQARNRNGERA
ncbi:flagellar export chaperone FliS [Halobacillus litoralis]|uniref:flagellar export chaperone FliS n=1 Tax=Halobacillus litoralis TaxID=45668 RepID=UPI001CD6E825|nr:flagellar export chaperone FliS [Halobacillus litoralis]MCA0971578.1 flagellar export chaperone FliS [Halobacillus litoralis]